MRNLKFAGGEYYHICGRGNNKQQIFFDDLDYVRFLAYLLVSQADVVVDLDEVTLALRKGSPNFLQKEKTQAIMTGRYVHLVGFCLMPNHYHLILFNKAEDGISRFMQRVLNAYTRYSNVKRDKIGHVFQGPFKAVHVESNEQLLYLSAYVHNNACELPGWRKKAHEYKWSSYKSFLNGDKYQGLLTPEIILEQVDSGEEYMELVKNSGAKDLKLDHMLI